MKIQKGLVKYKDRSDIICTYGITDDGRQFYFLNDSKLSNNNIIVTSSLVEAIDSSVMHTNVGVIDADGNVVIPCENKNIKLVTKDILLVEKSNPTSQSVIEAAETRKDPLAATKLVSASAVVKDKIFAVMGNDGRFLFNDQFSEASLFDLNGNNLVEDNYYSFIAINRVSDTIFLSDNTPESSVDRFSLVTMKLNDETTVASTEVPENSGFANIDVNDVNVDKTEIDNAMNPEAAPQEGVQENVEPAENAEVPQEVAPQQEEAVAPAENAEVPQEEGVPTTPEVPVDNTEVVQEAAPQQEEVAPATPETPVENVEVAQEVAPVQEEVVAPQQEEMAPIMPETPVENTEVAQEEVTPTTPEAPVEDVMAPEENEEQGNEEAELPPEPVTTDNVVAQEEEEQLVDEVVPEETAPQEVAPQEEATDVVIPDVGSELEEKIEETQKFEEPVERIEKDNLLDEVNFEHRFDYKDTNESKTELFDNNDRFSFEDNGYSFEREEKKPDLDDFLNSFSNREIKKPESRVNNYSSRNNMSSSAGIMNSAAETITRLIEANKSQLNELDEYKHQVQELTDLNRKVVDRAKEDRDRIRSSIQNYEDQIDRLKAQMDSLEDRVRDKERIINSQSAELTDLRSQVEGSNNLAKILEDAQNLLGNERY